MTDLASPFQPGDHALICALIGDVKIAKPVIIIAGPADRITVCALTAPGLTQTLPASGHRLPGTPSHVWLEVKK